MSGYKDQYARQRASIELGMRTAMGGIPDQKNWNYQHSGVRASAEKKKFTRYGNGFMEKKEKKFTPYGNGFFQR